MRKQINSIFVYLFFIACWIFFFYFYPYHLHYKEQITLCVLQPDFLQTYLQKPAFLTEICGDFPVDRWWKQYINPHFCVHLAGTPDSIT